MAANRFRVSFLSDENILELVVLIAQSCEIQEPLNYILYFLIIYFKMVNCIYMNYISVKLSEKSFTH